MKRTIILLLAIIISFGAVNAQSIKTGQLYHKYKGEEGVVSIWLPGIAMRLAASIADLEQEERQFLRSIRSLRVLTIENNDLYPDVNFVREAGLEGGKMGYKVLVEVHSDNEDVTILGREKNGKLKDMLVLVGGSDNVMVHIKGKMNADMIGSIAQIAGVEKTEILTSL